MIYIHRWRAWHNASSGVNALSLSMSNPRGLSIVSMAIQACLGALQMGIHSFDTSDWDNTANNLANLAIYAGLAALVLGRGTTRFTRNMVGRVATTSSAH